MLFLPLSNSPNLTNKVMKCGFRFGNGKETMVPVSTDRKTVNGETKAKKRPRVWNVAQLDVFDPWILYQGGHIRF